MVSPLFILLFVVCLYVLINTKPGNYQSKHSRRIFKDENGNVVSHRTLETEEQDIAAQYINENDKVLELGARYGTVSALILDNISDTKDCVIVDPDKSITQALKNNLKNCGYGDAQIFVGTVGSNKMKIHSNDSYATHTESCDTKDCDVENMTYRDLQDTYGIIFNTIVADCEGCLPDLIDHISIYYENLEPINKIIFETDRPRDVDYDKVYTKLNECGFKNIRNKFVQIWVR